MEKQYQNYLIVDLEATCCDRQSIKRQEMEIIEIGAVMVNAESLAVLCEFQTFIKPVRHPRLTPFCRELTSIRQAEVDAAPGFAQALQQFKSWLHQFDSSLFCSWGDYDKKQFEQDCAYHRLPYPFASAHLNIKQLFSSNQGLDKKHGMAQALRLADLPLQGTHHRGIDDARNMARLMPFVLGHRKI